MKLKQDSFYRDFFFRQIDTAGDKNFSSNHGKENWRIILHTDSQLDRKSTSVIHQNLSQLLALLCNEKEAQLQVNI